MFVQGLAKRIQRGACLLSRCKSLDRDCDGTAPELVEGIGELLDDRTRGENIVIAKLRTMSNFLLSIG